MKKSVLSLLTGTALLGTVGVASAAEPMVLTNAAMDAITAGSDSYISQTAAIVSQNESYYGDIYSVNTIVQIAVAQSHIDIDVDF